MIDSFEARLVNLIADRLAGTTEILSVNRMRDGLPLPTAVGPRAAVLVTTARPQEDLGDDRQEVLGDKGARALRPVLRLDGEALVRLEVKEATNVAQRSALVKALDRLLLVLHDADVRSGKAFQTATDQGFALDGGFRLVRFDAIPLGTPAIESRRFDVVYAWSGRFWPVRPALLGPRIDDVQTRQVVLPMQLPQDLEVKAGAAPITVSIPLDLTATGGAVPALVARLQGATPPGTLVGATTGLPPGFFAVPVAAGVARVQYRAPATATEPADAVVELRIGGDGSAWTVLETFPIRVRP